MDKATVRKPKGDFRFKTFKETRGDAKSRGALMKRVMQPLA